MMTELFNEMMAKYNRLAYTHNYIYGFTFQDVVYAVATGTDVMPFILKLDRASRGQGYALRFCPTNKQKAFLLARGAKAICSKKFFEETVAASKYNRGEIFEKMITEMGGEKWVKDTLKFNEGPDAVIDGVPYQIKFEKATFTNEKTLARM